jgi:hypothetical protein
VPVPVSLLEVPVPVNSSWWFNSLAIIFASAVARRSSAGGSPLFFLEVPVPIILPLLISNNQSVETHITVTSVVISKVYRFVLTLG